MAVRQILAMKRAALQSHINSLSAKEMLLSREIDRLKMQPDGLNPGSQSDQFQVAAKTAQGAHRAIIRLQAQKVPLQQEIQALAREKLALDIADKKLAKEERQTERLQASRADLRA